MSVSCNAELGQTAFFPPLSFLLYLSGVTGLRSPVIPLLVVFAEKGLPKLIRAYHDGTGRGHFDNPRKETCKQSTKAVLCNNLPHHTDGGRGGLRRQIHRL